ncbi:hypothetical protein FIBSPDRAFT_139042 [Athelia psychrophila]|uniref:Uncharacterized protein n=1 Tax=Athelia psychrophila TaxID=1759441 RepID=A0A166BZW4_9AGAM|nr:hypothetical protein FIBSPDRAFT_139042 [Fibularhizoctonia sp. CBS 109695]
MSWGACSELGLDTIGPQAWPRPGIPNVEQRWRSDMLPQLHAPILEMLQWRAGSVAYFAFRVMKTISGVTLASAGTTTATGHDVDGLPHEERIEPQRWLSASGQLSAHL